MRALSLGNWVTQISVGTTPPPGCFGHLERPAGSPSNPRGKAGGYPSVFSAFFQVIEGRLFIDILLQNTMMQVFYKAFHQTEQIIKEDPEESCFLNVNLCG